MRKFFTKFFWLLFIACWISHFGYSQTWQPVGTPGLSARPASETIIKVDANGTPYVAYLEIWGGYNVVVKKYDGHSWVDIGPAGSSGRLIDNINFELDSKGVPYVAYRDEEIGSKVTVRKFDGTSWINVGPTGVSDGAVNFPKLALTTNGNLYVAYVDYANGNLATVKKFNGTEWEVVGSPIYKDGSAHYMTLAVDMNGKPFVSYLWTDSNTPLTDNLKVDAFNGSNWVTTGETGISRSGYFQHKIVIDANGTPFLLYADPEKENKATLKKYNGKEWVNVGSPGFSAGYTSFTTIQLDSKGNPLVAYKDYENIYKARVKKFNGSTWTDVGTDGISADRVSWVSLAINARDIPYLAYEDEAHESKITVMKYALLAPITFTTQPVAKMINGGENASLTVGATGGDDLTYQWQVSKDNGVNFTDLSNGLGYSGATTTTLNITKAPISLNGFIYRAIAKNNSTASATSNSVTFTVKVPPFDNTRVWQMVGVPGFSAGSATNTCLGLDVTNTPFVVFADGTINKQATVKKFTNGNWVTVGTEGFSAGMADATNLVMDATGTPYVAYQDVSNGNKATVKKYNGTSWIEVGAAGFSAGHIDFPNLKFDASGTLFISYRDRANGNKATVKKFTGSDWVDVGTPGFSDGDAFLLNLAVDATGTPYVAYYNGANGMKVTIKKYTGNYWVNVGAANFSTGGTSLNAISLAVDASGTPYVAYQDGTNGNKVTVRKYNGTNWEVFGTVNISDGAASNINLALDASGTPFISYADEVNGSKATVMKYNGSSWADVGLVNFTPGESKYHSLSLDTSGTPFVAFADGVNVDKATVMTFASGSPLLIGTHPLASIINGGENTTLTVAASGQVTLTYQWQISKNGGINFKNIHNGLGYSGTTTSTLIITQAPISMNNYQFRAIISNGVVANTAISNAASLTVKVPTFDNSRAWQVVGKAGYSAGQIAYTSLALDNDGTPYVAFQDNGNSFKASVTKFNGINWETVGLNKVSESTGDYVSLALDAKGTPFISYRNFANAFKATVKKLNGTNWESVGTPGLSAGMGSHTSIALDANGRPYIAFSDSYNGEKITVKRFNGTSWVLVGSEAFSVGVSEHLSLTLDANDTPYLAYQDGGFSGGATVMKFNGSSWEAVGTPGFSAGGATYISLKIDANGTPYVGFQNYDNKATVMKFDGNKWVSVGRAEVSAGMSFYTSLALDGSGTPYIAYEDRANGNKVTTMKFNGTDWESVGMAGFSVGVPSFISLALDAYGIPYVAYRDGANGSKATVMRFGDAAPSPPTVTEAANCGPGEVILNAAGGSAGNYRWFTTATGGTAIANASNSTYITPNLTASTTYYVSVVRGTFESSRTAVTAGINAIPDAPEVTTTVTYCQDASANAINATGTSLKWYTTATGGIASTTAPIPNTAAVGTTAYYVSQTNNDCESLRAVITITVNALPTVSAGSVQSVCVNELPVTLAGFSPAGGTWSGTGVSTVGVFNPATAGEGAHTLTYSVTQNGCMAKATKTINVTAAPSSLILIAFTNPVCSSITDFALTGGQPTGGVYSGTGVRDGLFNASTAGVGTHTITYTFTINGCTATATQDITVITCTGLEESLSLYPNPAEGKLQVNLTLPAKTDLELRLLDGNGKIILKQNYPSVAGEFKQLLSLDGIVSGLYLLQVITDDEIIAKRVVIK